MNQKKLLQFLNPLNGKREDADSVYHVAEAGNAPWNGSMIPEAIGNGQKVKYERSSYSTVEIQWISREKKSDGCPVRMHTPVEKTRVFLHPGIFTVAGKMYHSIDQLTAEKDPSGRFCRDIYGREVYCEWERFPCFDSYDYLYENRYYRWFFLRENGALHRVFYTDEQFRISVTEHVRYLENYCWEWMKKLGYWE